MTAHGFYYNSEATRTKRAGEEVTRSSTGEAGSREQAFDSIDVGIHQQLDLCAAGTQKGSALPEAGGAENREQLDPLIPPPAARGPLPQPQLGQETGEGLWPGWERGTCGWENSRIRESLCPEC